MSTITRSQVVHLQQRIDYLRKKLQPHQKNLTVMNQIKEYEYQVSISEMETLLERRQELINQLSELDTAINIRYVRASRKLIQDMRWLQRFEESKQTIL